MMRNIYQSSQFNDKNVFWEKKIFLRDFSCTQGRMCVYGLYAPVQRLAIVGVRRTNTSGPSCSKAD